MDASERVPVRSKQNQAARRQQRVTCMATDINFQVRVQFRDRKNAEIARNTLIVDAEPRKNILSRRLEIVDSCLHVYWTAKEARILRTSVNAFFENIILIIQTIEQFDLKEL